LDVGESSIRGEGGDESTSAAGKFWSRAQRIEIPAAEPDLGELRSEGDSSRVRDDLKSSSGNVGVDEDLQVSAVGDDVDSSPPAIRILDVVLAAEVERVF